MRRKILFKFPLDVFCDNTVVLIVDVSMFLGNGLYECYYDLMQFTNGIIINIKVRV
jgi:hypothetical protein